MYQQTQQDLKAFSKQMGQFWKRIPDRKWDDATGSRDKDWTLHQVLAHILSIAQTFNKAATAALRNEDLQVREFTTRGQFGDWNTSEVNRLTQAAPNGLIVQYLQELRIASEIIAKITPENDTQTARVVQFNRPARAIDYIHWQFSHAGIVHGAQVVYPLKRDPLWVDYDDEFIHRLTQYYLQQWSMSYWADLGPSQPETINFHIGGDGGGEWHIIAAPDGGATDAGSVDGANYDLFFESPQVFFSVFTNHLSIRKAMVSGQMRLASDVRDTLDMLRYFAPKRPVLDNEG